MQIVSRSSSMSTEQDMPSVAQERSALAANLRERARVLDQVGPAGEASALRTFTHPSWRELHAQERSTVDLVAGDAMVHIFGTRSAEKVTPRIAADLEQGATYLVRRIHPEFVKAAHDNAVDVLRQSDEFKALTAGRPAGQATVIAHRLVSQMWAGFHAVLEGTTPIKPAVYMRCVAAQVEKGAR